MALRDRWRIRARRATSAARSTSTTRTYLPEGDVRISGTVTGTLGTRPVAMGYMARATWTLEKDTLGLD